MGCCWQRPDVERPFHLDNWGSGWSQVAQQKKANPEDDVAELAPVWDNSVGWGSFVAVSTNLRYQAVGAFEERVIVSHYFHGLHHNPRGCIFLSKTNDSISTPCHWTWEL